MENKELETREDQDNFEENKKGINFSRISTIIAIGIIIGTGALLIIRNMNGYEDQKKAEETMRELVQLRIALEKYYQVAKDYPDLTKEEVWNDLKLLDHYDKTGKLISFAEIYGKNVISATPSNDKNDDVNTVRDTSDFKNGTKSGGWNYNYSGRTGEIHANLPFNYYSQQIEWDEY